MPKKLKELPVCPFCGGRAKRVASKFTLPKAPILVNGQYEFERATWYGVKCTQCGIAQPKRVYLSREASDEAWENYLKNLLV